MALLLLSAIGFDASKFKTQCAESSFCASMRPIPSPTLEAPPPLELAGAPTLDGGVDDVVFLPAPDFGNGSVIGAGSWQFGASGTCENPEGVAAFVE